MAGGASSFGGAQAGGEGGVWGSEGGARSAGGAGGAGGGLREAGGLRARLAHLLESSTEYDAAKLLERVRASPGVLPDETVLMARLGLHREALTKLVHRSKDMHAAKVGWRV